MSGKRHLPGAFLFLACISGFCLGQDSRPVATTQPIETMALERAAIHFDLERVINRLPEDEAKLLREVAAAFVPRGAGSLLSVDKTQTFALASPFDANVVTYAQLPPLEAIIGSSNFLPVYFFEGGMIAQKPVGRVTLIEPLGNLKPGDGLATGFLVSRDLFLTNNHVLPDVNFCSNVEVQFNYQFSLRGRLGPIDAFEFDPASFFLTSKDLDFTIVRLKSLERTTPSADGPITRTVFPGDQWGWIRLGADVKIAQGQPANVIQHPDGRPKELALQNNSIMTVGDKFVRYKSDTQPGSSGSPVFSNSWTLIALHHAAGEKQGDIWINNEGVRIDRIIEELERQAATEPGIAAVLSELRGK